MSRPRVLIAEKLADAGVAALSDACDVVNVPDWDVDELARQLASFDALVIRSATKVTEQLLEHADTLTVIGRAGVGVDNVDLDAASRRGIVVVNAPTSNVLSVAEHTIGLMLALARKVSQGDAGLRNGQWLRSQLKGVELSGRTLVLLGMGRIGQLVAERARAFGMRVVGYDPFVPSERFARMGVEQATTIEQALAEGDVVSLHMPLTDDTRNLIGASELDQMKPGALLLNTARGGLVDLDALTDALQRGIIGGAGIDVFPVEPPPTDHAIFSLDNVVVTPHLAASTIEAQDRAGTQVAEQVVAALTGGVVTSAVNVAAIGPEDLEALQPWVPLATRLAQLAHQLADGPVRRLHVMARGEIAAYDVRLLSTGALVGLLAATTDEPVNVVNAPHVAQQRGLIVETNTDEAARTFRSLATISVDAEHGSATVSGTTIGAAARPWVTNVLGFSLELELVEHMAFFRYSDVPGVIGRVGSAFGEAGVNIANMSVSRGEGQALMAVSFDDAPPSTVIEQLNSELDFEFARVVSLA